MTAPEPAHRNPRLRRVARRFVRSLGVGVLLLAVAILALGAWCSRDPSPGFEARRGTLTEIEQQSERTDGGHRVRDLRLVSTSGLVVELAVKGPSDPGPVLRPLIVLLGGHRTGRRAVDLIPDTRGVWVAALDYPYAGDPKTKGLALVAKIPEIRRAVADTPPAVLLALDYLSAYETVDPGRIELVGVSLGAPFACIAGALEPRFHRVWSIHGGGDLWSLIEFGLRRRHPFAPARYAIATATHALAFGDSLAPERWVGRIAPRELVLINARDDERIPRACVDVVRAAAGEPTEQIWLAGGHVHPKEEEVVRELVDRVLDRVVRD